MRQLLYAALLSSATMLAALPTGRYLGSDPNSLAHSHASDDIFVDEYLQKLWDAAPSSTFPSPPRMPATDHSAPSAMVPDQHATGQRGGQDTAYSPPHHRTDTPVVSSLGGSSAQKGSAWTVADTRFAERILRGSPPSSRENSPPRMAALDLPHAGQHGPSTPLHISASDNTLAGHNAPIIQQPASKRLKKQHAASSPPSQHHASMPTVSQSFGPSTHAGPVRAPPSHHLGSHDQRLTSLNAVQPLRGTHNVLPTIKPPKKLNPLKLPKVDLTVTAKAEPQEVKNALLAVPAHFTHRTQIRNRSRILKAAVASVGGGCTTRSQYLDCMKEKYGPELVISHPKALGHFIKMDMKDKGTYSVEAWKKGAQRIDPNAQIGEHTDKWFAELKRGKQNALWLKLPPTNRKEPSVRDGDVGKYHELIKHLDLQHLSAGEYIKHAYRPLEETPDMWHSKVPKMAMEADLSSKDVSEEMFAHFQKVHHSLVRNVSFVLEWGG